TAGMQLQEIGAGPSRNVAKETLAVAAKELRWLGEALRRAVLVSLTHLGGVAKGMAVGHENIQVAVVLDVEQAGSPSHLVPADRNHAGFGTDVREKVTAVIAIDGPALVEKGADEKIRPAVAREVIGLDSHAAHGVALPV